MASFEIHFDAQGNVLVNNIEGVSGNACLGLTKPYVESMGVLDANTVMLPEATQQQTNRPLENS